MDKKKLEKLMDWACSKEWGYKTWKLKKMKLPKKKVWVMRRGMITIDNKRIMMSIKFEEW